jgi:type IV pilus biogenesis protein CpaD/CtpE
MNSERLTRRGFARRTALAAAVGSSAVGSSKDAAAVPQPQAQAPLDSADQAEVDAKFANVVRQYGSRLSDEQKTRVRGVLGRHQRMLARVRSFTIENSDPPATGLRLYPSDTAPPKKG